MIKIKNKKIICPNGKNHNIWVNLDMLGGSPYYLHCDECNIFINAPYYDDLLSLFDHFHEPNTHIMLIMRCNQILYLRIYYKNKCYQIHKDNKKQCEPGMEEWENKIKNILEEKYVIKEEK